jgi:deoxyribonuclease IV
MKIGSHVSIAQGLDGAAKEAVSYGANTFMIYTGAPQNTRRQPIENLKIEEGLAYMQKHNIDEIVVHAPYIINLASFKDSIYDIGVQVLASEIARTEAIGAKYLVMHPGAFTERNIDYGIDRIVSGLNKVLTPDTKVTLCLETMAGKGTEIGRNFNELKRIIDGVTLSDKIAICFDTCHVHDSGYDIVNDLDGVMQEFDKQIGLDKLKVYHINGSLNVKGAKKDRHANIGANADNPKGLDNIGFDAIYSLVHSKYAKDRLLILETPWLDNKTNLYKEEIAALRKI